MPRGVYNHADWPGGRRRRCAVCNVLIPPYKEAYFLAYGVSLSTGRAKGWLCDKHGEAIEQVICISRKGAQLA